jgi:RNA polymerase sigma factor (sigma-70 family)
LKITDKRILELLSDPLSKERGFELLVEKYTTRIYNLVNKMVIIPEDTEDLVQEIFLKIWKNISKFRGDSELYTWIYRIAVNETIDFLNKKNKRFFIPIEDYIHKQIETVENEAFYDFKSIEKRLHKAIISLPPKQKAIFELRYFENMKHEEIAKILDISVGNVKSQYHNAVEKIKKLVSVELDGD